ncbi:hypothetical protein JHK85_050560 [Glycine max]|nr:hypothetical protein JHK85_050560 [Glycine max]KAH1154058.1 hypothetical protein GYH30_049615 [Glycine max]
MRSRNALKASIESKKEDAKPPSLSTDPIYETNRCPSISHAIFLGISMLEQLNKYYFIIRGHKIVLEADSSILLIMEKL